jgi:hypothetical protein
MAEFETNLMRAQLAATWFSLGLQTARELFGKSYLSLSQPEKSAVDQIVLANVAGNYQAITLNGWRPSKLGSRLASKPPQERNRHRRHRQILLFGYKPGHPIT